MQRVFLSFIMVLATFLASAQAADKAKHIKVADLVKREFNAKNYKGIYKLMDANFQSQLSETDLVDFLTSISKNYCSNIQSLNYKDQKVNYHIFTASCLSGDLELILGCDVKGKITFMQWLPPKMTSPPQLETESYTNDNPKSNPLDLKMDSIVKDFMSNPANCGLSIAVYQNKKISYYNYGNVKRGANVLPSNKTIYEIGSISKTFTGILFAQAINDKKLGLNDAVKKHLGDDYKNLAYGGKDIELVHLANHSGRVHRIPFDLISQPNYSEQNPYKNYSKEMVYAYMKKMVPDTLPGTKNEYSNLGMGLLGIIEEKVYNKTYEELITEYICGPLGMNDTKITISGTDTNRFAKGYGFDGSEVQYWDLGALAGAGGIRSTSEDMMKYTKANLEETNPAFKLSHQTTYSDKRNNVALAWHITTTKKGNELIWHNGRTAGFSSFCGFIKSKDVAVVVLGNSGNPVDQVAIGILKFLQ